MTTRPDEPSHTNLEAGLGNSPPDLEGVGPAQTGLEAEPDGAPRERTPYVPDNQSMKVLLGALAVGALVAVVLIVLLVSVG